IICCPRLDDLEGSYASLMAFLESGTGKSIPVCILFNNEEIGSRTQQGADSTFLYDTLKRIAFSLELSEEYFLRLLAASFMASCDNAHGTHPNYPELADRQNSPSLNKGIVIKFNSSGHYGTDDLSAAFFKMICDKAGVPYQHYYVNADLRCGSTLGYISESHVSITIADVGLPQLSMHSCLETAGAKDMDYMISALKILFESYGERYGHELTLDEIG
ncbi:MAG: M18 family aminopeptidase, partial [Lachnospiraceae bacterium]|nr:M18 family aminopeptidase [Lachnospiraceae bacterium]